jgi:group I intron endonuclease
MKISAIYGIRSALKPEHIYIGSAIDFANRQSVHLYQLRKGISGCVKLQNHFNKYGETDLTFYIIERCSPEDLILREQYYIDILNPFFNIRRTAENNLGMKWSQESRDKFSTSRRGKTTSKKGQKDSLETRIRKSNSHKGKQPMLGKHHSEKAREKMSKSRRGGHHSEETKRKISEALKSFFNN